MSEDKYPLIVEAMGETVEKGGFGPPSPPSPSSISNRRSTTSCSANGRRSPRYGKMVLGYFGKTPVAPDPEVVKEASEH
jgi:pyruvate carboxylase subunit B